MRRPIYLLIPNILVLGFALMTLCASQAAGETEKMLHVFSFQGRGGEPNGLVADSAGNLYGTTYAGGAYNDGAVYKLAPRAGGGWTETVLHSFSIEVDGAAPVAPVVDSAGNIYGITQYGSPGGCNGGCGSIFKLTPKPTGGWLEITIYTVPPSAGYPSGGLALDSSGDIYGATANYSGVCSVFKLVPSGANWTQTNIYTFSCAGGYITALVFDGAGNLYGTLSSDTSASQGFVFELTPASGGTWTEKVSYTFLGGISGGVPTGRMLFQGGNLYGTTLDGGEAQCENANGGCGVVFELKPGSNGQWTETVVYTFQGSNSDGPIHPNLSAFDSSGNLYGYTEQGGAGVCPYCGSVFEISPDGNGSWKESDLWDFTGQRDGDYPTAVVLGPAGQVYGATPTPTENTIFGGEIFQLTPKSQPGGSSKLSRIYAFPFTDGMEPFAGLVADGSGNLYGTTAWGGKDDQGAVFEVSPTVKGWKESVIYSFGPASNILYSNVTPGGLVFDAKGNLYGVTEFGGANQAGSVFELSPVVGGGWQEEDLVSFSAGNGPREPVSSLVLDKAGNIYGVSLLGGTHAFGTVFELTQNSSGQWSSQTIYSFSGSDGAKPQAGLTIDATGNLYGTTELGGSGACHDQTGGCGTVFELSYIAGSGWTETVLHSFLGAPGNDGAEPVAALIVDASGNLYGTTSTGGIRSQRCALLLAGCGTVFELSPVAGGWSETILYEFQGGSSDGANPYGPVVFDPSGDLYGTTSDAGTYLYGTLFKLSPVAGGGWTESVIHNFGNGSDGKYPGGSLVLDAAGNLYGAASAGGASGGVSNNGQGIIFEITPTVTLP
jgi:uncharacterized repeat protein (TIGR03803 family)